MVATDVASRGIGMIDHDSAHIPLPSPQLTSCGCEEVVLSSLHPHCALHGIDIAIHILVPVRLFLLCHLALSLGNFSLFREVARLRAHALSLTYSLLEGFSLLLRVTSGVQRQKPLSKGLMFHFAAAR